MSRKEYKEYEGIIESFEVDKKWIKAWKRANGIVMREVTHFKEK